MNCWTSLRSRCAPRWLFPGRIPGQPIHARSLTARLSRHGITTHAARNTAIGTLAAELPAPVLADLNINTATSWTRSTGRDWTEYLAARTRHQDETAGDKGLLQYARHSPRLRSSIHFEDSRDRVHLPGQRQLCEHSACRVCLVTAPRPGHLLSRRVNIRQDQ